jgi:hypothetical protein
MKRFPVALAVLLLPLGALAQSAPAKFAGLQLKANDLMPVCAAGNACVKYNSATGLELSINGGPYVAVGGLPNLGPGPGAFTWATGDALSLDAQGRVTAITNVTRTLTGGPGINAIGTLAADRTISIDVGFSPLWGGVHTFALPPVIGNGTGTAKTLQFDNLAGLGVLSWNPTATRTLTLPDATDTLIGRATIDTLSNKAIDGLANTFTNIGNGSLVSSSLTVGAGTGLAGGGLVSLGGSVSLSLPSVGTAGVKTLATGETITTDAQGRVSATTTATRTLTAGVGLIGGGTLALDRAFAVDQSAAFNPTWLGVHTFGTYQDNTIISAPALPAAGNVRFFGASRATGMDTLAYQTAGGYQVVIGRDSLVGVRNVSGATITKGSAVYINGSNGALPRIDKALADASMAKLPALGVLPQDIANNTNGFVMVRGVLSNFNTSGWSAGDTLYVDPTTAGALTNVEPAHPLVQQAVGTVEVVNVANGSIMVSVVPLNLHQLDGVNGSNFSIGNGTGTAARQLIFKNINSGILSWQPTGSRSLNLPDATDTLVGRATTDTLTNKSIDGGTNTLTNIPASAITGGGSITLNAGAGLATTLATVPLGGSATLSIGGTSDTAYSTGAFTWAGASGKALSLTSTAAAISITAGASSTWDTSGGTVRATTFDRSTAGALSLGTGTATSLSIGSANTTSGMTIGVATGALINFQWNGQTQLSWSGNGTSFGFTGGNNRTINVGSAAADTAGNSLVVTAGAGGAASATAGGAGGIGQFTGASGGAATGALPAGLGGQGTFGGGTGGTGAAPGGAGPAAGGLGVLRGGGGGTVTGGNGGANGGNAAVRGGTGTGTGTNGNVLIGDANTVAVSIAGMTGGLTLTAGTTSTWDSKDGTIRAATLDRTTAGTLAIGTTNANAITLAQSTTLTDGKTLTGSLNGNAAAQTAAISLQNNTSASAGTLVQQPPGLEMAGSSFDATNGLIAKKWLVQGVPVSTAATSIASQLSFYSSEAGGAYAQRAFVNSAGAIVASGNVFAGGAAGTGGVLAASMNPNTAATAMAIGTNGNASSITLGANTTLSAGKTLAGSINGIGTAQTVHTSLANTTAAADAAQQYSPMIELVGQGYNKTATASRQVKWGFQAIPSQQSVGEPVANLGFYTSFAGSPYALRLSFLDTNTAAGITIGSNLNAITIFSGGTTSQLNGVPYATAQTWLPDRDAVAGYSLGSPTLRYYDAFTVRANHTSVGIGDVASLPWGKPYIASAPGYFSGTGVATNYALRVLGGNARFQAMSTPSSITIATVGSGGTTSRTYAVVAVGSNGAATLAGSVTSTGTLTYSATAYDAVSWPAVPGAAYYDVYFTAVSQAHWLGSTTATTFNNKIGDGNSPGIYSGGSVYRVIDTGTGPASYFVYAVDADGHLSPAATVLASATGTFAAPVSISWSPIGGAVDYLIASGSNTNIIGNSGNTGATQNISVTVPNGGLVRTLGTTVTATIPTGHGLKVGDTFTLTSADTTNFPSGVYTVGTVTGSTVFTYGNATPPTNTTSANVAISYIGGTVAAPASVPIASFTDYGYPARVVGSTVRNNTGDVVFDGRVTMQAPAATATGAQLVHRDSAGFAHYGVDAFGLPSLGSRFEFRENWLWTATAAGASTTLTASQTNATINNNTTWAYTSTANATGFTNLSGFAGGTPVNAGITIGSGTAAGTNSTLLRMPTPFMVFNVTNTAIVAEWPMVVSAVGANGVTVAAGVSNNGVNVAHPGGYWFEKGNGDTNWKCMTDTGTVGPTANSTLQSIAPVAATAQIFRIEVFGAGTPYGAATAKFYVDGVLMCNTTTNVFTGGSLLFSAYNAITVGSTQRNLSIGPLLLMFNQVPSLSMPN